MSAAPERAVRAAPERAAPQGVRRAAESLQGLGVGLVLLAFWGTAAVLSRWCQGTGTLGGESVRRKA
ncbi:hypothetical protein [Streptomyces sp. CB02488]|uniref:hypothetical protein n=1 Tax=Streptomyces sp. CB02488 TaxID=1703920 RepID=UPI001301691F|nr:hypothetical protein [Streptomyces sp. CB02488]